MEEYLISATDADGNIWVLRSDKETANHLADLFRVNDYTRVTVALAGSEPD